MRTVYCPLEEQYVDSTVRWKNSILSAGRSVYCPLEEQYADSMLSAGRTVCGQYCPLEEQYTVRWKNSILSAGRTEYCQLEEQNTVCWKNKILSAGRTEYCPLENCQAPLRLYSPIQGPKDQYRDLVSDCSIPRRLTDNMNPLAAWYMAL